MFRKFGDEDVAKLFKEISTKGKLKEIMFKGFISNLPRPSKQWTLFSNFYNANLSKDCLIKKNKKND